MFSDVCGLLLVFGCSVVWCGVVVYRDFVWRLEVYFSLAAAKKWDIFFSIKTINLSKPDI